MVKVKNNVDQPLALPGGPTIPVGQEREVPDWKYKKSNSVVQAWIRAGAIIVEDDEESAKIAEEGDDDTAEDDDTGEPASGVSRRRKRNR